MTNPTKPLTDQQAAIVGLANRGYPAPKIARALRISPSLVYDQIRFARKKGHDATLLTAAVAKRRIDLGEARRIAANPSGWRS